MRIAVGMSALAQSADSTNYFSDGKRSQVMPISWELSDTTAALLYFRGMVPDYLVVFTLDQWRKAEYELKQGESQAETIRDQRAQLALLDAGNQRLNQALRTAQATIQTLERQVPAVASLAALKQKQKDVRPGFFQRVRQALPVAVVSLAVGLVVGVVAAK